MKPDMTVDRQPTAVVPYLHIRKSEFTFPHAFKNNRKK